MYGCESWTIKKAECQRIDAFELWCWRRLLRVPWTARRSNQSILKKISPGCSGRNDAKAETPVLWPPYVKSWLIGKDSDAGRDWGQEEKETTKDETAGWHHRLDGPEFEWTLGVGDRQGSLACCNSWGRKESDTTEQLNWTELIPGQMELDQSWTPSSLGTHSLGEKLYSKKLKQKSQPKANCRKIRVGLTLRMRGAWSSNMNQPCSLWTFYYFLWFNFIGLLLQPNFLLEAETQSWHFPMDAATS